MCLYFVLLRWKKHLINVISSRRHSGLISQLLGDPYLKIAANDLIKPLATLCVMFGLVYVSPVAPMDPWNLLSPRKIATMLLALTLIQVLGAAMVHVLGARAGSIVTGFLGGLLSSTATTAALAKRSKESAPEHVSAEQMTFFAATAAMLVEGLVLLLTGTTGIHWRLLFVFLGPILITALMIFRLARKSEHSDLKLPPANFRVLPILKLAAFIAVILALSKILQNLFGRESLLVLTFLVSLFEIHGSVIANVQLHDSGSINVALLGGLLAISVAASYLSKLFLVYTIGSKALRWEVAKSTFVLFVSLIASWLVSVWVG